MRVDFRTSIIAGLIVCLAASAKAAESAVFDLAPRSGPSRFVTEIDGKPAQIGPAPLAPSGAAPNTVTMLPPPQSAVEPEPQSDKAASGDTDDNETNKNPDDQLKADMGPETAAKDGAQDDQSEAESSEDSAKESDSESDAD